MRALAMLGVLILLPRMRRLFNRVRLEKEEVAILRGMLTTFETPKRRG